MGILHYLDVAIGFALAMAVLSAMVSAAAQTALTAFRRRVHEMETGVGSLLVNAGVGADKALEAAHVLMRERSLSARVPWNNGVLEKIAGWLRRGSAEAIPREELAMAVLRKGSEEPFKSMLTTLGVTDPAAVLHQIEEKILEWEAGEPQLAAQIWRTRALQKVAPKLAARLFSQFDEAMDRVQDSVSFSGKIYSAILAAVFLAYYPVNSFDVLSRLTNDEALRKAVVAEAEGLKNQNNPDLKTVEKRVLDAGLFGDVFTKPKACGDFSPGELAKPGVFLTWICLCFGSPFWLGALNRLLGLRSEIQRRASEQSAFREKQQPAVP